MRGTSPGRIPTGYRHPAVITLSLYSSSSLSLSFHPRDIHPLFTHCSTGMNTDVYRNRNHHTSAENRPVDMSNPAFVKTPFQSNENTTVSLQDTKTGFGFTAFNSGKKKRKKYWLITITKIFLIHFRRFNQRTDFYCAIHTSIKHTHTSTI